jgi:hypothetical protein
MGILVSIGMWILSFVTGPVVKQILTTTIQDFLQTAQTKALPAITAAIKEATTRDDMTGEEKLRYVVDSIQLQFPDLARSAIYNLTTGVYRSIMENKTP